MNAIRRPSILSKMFFSVLAWVVPILLGLISTPVLISYLGADRYGIFALVIGFISYSFAFGIGKVASKYVPEYLATGDENKAAGAVAATFWFSLVIGACGAAILALLAPLLVQSVLLITPEFQNGAVRSLQLAGAIGLVLMLSQVFQYTLQGLHRFDQYVALTALSGALVSAGNIVLVIAGFGLVELFTWNLLVTAVIGMLSYWRATGGLPNISLLPSFSRRVGFDVVRYGGNIILYQIFGNALFIFERSWVVRKFGAAELTFYFVPMLLATYMHGFISSIVQALFPNLNELSLDRASITALYERALRLVLVIVAFTVTNFIVLGEPFLSTWVGEEVASESADLLVLHGLTFGLIALGIMSFQLAEVFRFPALNVIMVASWMGIAIPLMVLLSDRVGAEGVAVGRLIAAGVTVPVVIYTEHRFLGGVRWRFWLHSIALVGIAAALTAAAEIGISAILGSRLYALLAAGLVGTFVFVAAGIALGLITRDERQRIASLLGFRERSGDQLSRK